MKNTINGINLCFKVTSIVFKFKKIWMTIYYITIHKLIIGERQTERQTCGPLNSPKHWEGIKRTMY